MIFQHARGYGAGGRFAFFVGVPNRRVHGQVIADVSQKYFVRQRLLFQHDQNLGGAIQADKWKSRLIAQQFLQLVARRGFAGVLLFFRNKHAAYELEVLAEIAQVLFKHRFRPAVTTLMGCADIIADAIQANPQVGPAPRAALAATGLSG